MENKKSFGSYICQRRKELGYTQKEFAQKLFVTDSAVSKWERGLAYPDITLLQSICQILEISEKELLSSSEDVEGRRSEQLARKYMRLVKNYRMIQYILYGLAAIGCLIGNLLSQHTLSWFWIVVTAEAVGASLTLLPALSPEGQKGLYSLGAFTGSLILLLLACCVYSGGKWFFVAAAAVLFGMGLVFLPWTLRKIPLPECLSRQRAALYIGIETLLALLLLGAGCLHSGGEWFLVAAVSVLFGVGLVLGPVVLWYLPIQGKRGLVYVTSETVLLVLLLGVICLYEKESWFLSAALWSVFGITVTLLPVVIRQIPFPEPMRRHKALFYLAFESSYLLFALLVEGWGDWFPMPSLFVAMLCLALPWIWLVSLRYLPFHVWFRAAVGFWGTGLWAYLAPWLLDRILNATGWYGNNPYTLRLPVDFTDWQTSAVCTANILVLIYLGLGLLGVICGIIGLRCWRKRSIKK